MKASYSRQNERGSVLIMIFIGVALFGALSFTVSQIMRSGNPEMMGEQQASILADEIMNMGRQYRAAIQDLRISNGCAPEDISFENSVVAGYTNGTNTDCQVFHGDGGGLTYIAPNADWLDSINSSKALYGELYFPGHVCINGVGTSRAGSLCHDNTSDFAELLLIIPYLKQSICKQIAEATGTLNSNEIPIDYERAWANGNTKFTGSFSSDRAIINNNGSDSSRTLFGKLHGCFEGGGPNPASDTYHFYQVLIAR